MCPRRGQGTLVPGRERLDIVSGSGARRVFRGAAAARARSAGGAAKSGGVEAGPRKRRIDEFEHVANPRGSMYGIFTYIGIILNYFRGQCR